MAAMKYGFATDCEEYCMVDSSLSDRQSAFDVGRPVGSVDLGRVLQELDEIVQLLVGQVKVGHLATARGARGLGLNPRLDELGAATLVYIAQFGSEVGTLAQQGVATDAVIDLPYLLARSDSRGQIGPVIPLGKGLHRIEGQRDEQERKENSAPEEDVSRH